MLTIYKNNETALEILTAPAKGCWVNATDPTQEEITCLQEWGVPHDYITYPLDLDERSRTERENGEILIVLRIPYIQGEGFDIPYITIPLGIILTDQMVITICKYNNDLIKELASGRMRNLDVSKRNRFVLRLLLLTASKYLHYVREINKTVDALEDRLQASTRNKEVLELLKFQKSLTYFTTALRSNELMMERLQRSQLFKMYPEDEDLLEDVLTENQQAIEMTSIAGNILSQMMDAFASIISNNLNMIMKALASITIVLSLPTMVASFYGMNVDLPMEGHNLAFLFILGLSFAISLVVGYVFYQRDWF